MWSQFDRPTPRWFAEAKFGIFIHWGAYSVPAWAEPIGAAGTVPESEWFAHNAYAEWYWNTIRIPGSSAAAHHALAYKNAPYDNFLDAWHAEAFDPSEWARLFRSAGADYVVPTTKHHDGIALWDAPGTGERNAVRRGPKRDLVGAIAEAVRAEGMRFGVYYSGGLDWFVTPGLPPVTTQAEVRSLRPRDAAYHYYALTHLRDLIARYQPDVLWNDIEWPDVGKRSGPDGLAEMFREFYARNPDGVVNDRWGVPHSDFRTSEYSAELDSESAKVWENTRGIGLSFGVNSVELPQHALTPSLLARHWADVVSRGGRLLLNVGPTSAGQIPALQRTTLEAFGAWKRPLADYAARTNRATEASPQEHGWRCDWHTPDETLLFLGDSARYPLDVPGDTSRAEILTGNAELTLGAVVVHGTSAGPAVVRVPRSS